MAKDLLKVQAINSKTYNKRWCTLVSGLLSLVYTLLEKGTIAYVPQRTTLTAKFH